MKNTIQDFVPLFRVSTEKQRNNKKSKKVANKNTGLGLAAQRKSCYNYIKSVGGNIITEFEEIQSARNKDVIKFGQSVTLDSLLRKRPTLLAALNYCKEHNAILVVKEHTRLTRMKLLGEYLMASGVKFVCADSPNDDNLIISLKIAIGHEEALNISRRTSAGLQAKIAREGKWQKPNPLFVDGTLAARARKVWSANCAENENNIRAASIIESKRKEGLNYLQIANYLNTNKFKTAMGKSFQAIQVQRIASKYAA